MPLEKFNEPDRDSTYFNITGYFELPGTWSFDLPSDKEVTSTERILLTGSHSQAIAHELKNPEKKLGSLSIKEFSNFLKATNRTKDLEG